MIGSFWMAIMFYALVLFLMIDLAALILPLIHFNIWVPINIPPIQLYGETIILASIIGIILYGTIKAQDIKINSYDIVIPKKSSHLSQLNVVFLSDLHLGNIVHSRRLKGIVNKINRLTPDIVLLGGDIIDDSLGPYISQKMSATLSQISSTYGVYGVLGNHDGTARQQEKVVNHLEASGMKILLDEYVKIDDAFYLVGRIDNNVPRGGPTRKPLAEILTAIDQTFPIILIDHNPGKFWEAALHKVDLQISGHTHKGQFFPFNLITKKIFATDWGYLQKGNTQLIVSSGVATWGPPIRIGSHSEIVQVNITFSPPFNPPS